MTGILLGGRSGMSWRKWKLVLCGFVLAGLSLPVWGQQLQTNAPLSQPVNATATPDENAAYCNYLTEQAKAQSDLLRTPNALGAFTQPETGLPTQLVAGGSLSLSNVKKAGLTMDVARKNCDVYKASVGVTQTLQFALAAVEREALQNRLALIDAAEKSLQDLIDQTSKRVDAQDMTRPMLWELQTSKIKLDADRADTQAKIAAIYLPASLSTEPIKAQVAAKQAGDQGEQAAQDKLARQNNWDVALTVGAHQQINPVANNVGPYGEVTLSYNLASRAIDRHLDNAADAYSSWKKVQEGDAVRGMEALRTQVEANITAQQNRLTTLDQEQAQVASNLQAIGQSETTAALDFRNQLTSTQLLLGIESGDATFRLERLQEFLKFNY
jgi:hypothetical protein